MNNTSRQVSSIQHQNVLECLSQILVSIYRWNYKPLETEAKSLKTKSLRASAVTMSTVYFKSGQTEEK